jgi:hypothetical protein
LAKVFESKLSDAQKTQISTSPPDSKFQQLAQQYRTTPVAAFARNQAINYCKKVVEKFPYQTAQNAQNAGMGEFYAGQAQRMRTALGACGNHAIPDYQMQLIWEPDMKRLREHVRAVHGLLNGRNYDPRSPPDTPSTLLYAGSLQLP